MQWPGWLNHTAPSREEGGDERWLITYADMITLLLVLFIILYSMANTDLEKFQALAESLKDGFGATAGSSVNTGAPGGSGGNPLFPEGGASVLELFPEAQTPISIFEFAELLEGRGPQLAGPDSSAGADAGQDSGGGLRTEGLDLSGDEQSGDLQPGESGGEGDQQAGNENAGILPDRGIGEEVTGDENAGILPDRGIGEEAAGDENAGILPEEGIGEEVTGEERPGDLESGQDQPGQQEQGQERPGEEDSGELHPGDLGPAALGDEGTAGIGEDGTAGVDDVGSAGGEEAAGSLRHRLRGLVDRAAAEAGQAGMDIEGLPVGITIEYDERGIRITATPTELFFESGSARLKPAGRQFLAMLAPYLRMLPNRIEIQGHTDSMPINTMVYPSNWELSAGRAGSVIRHLISLGLTADRLQAAGYADTLPKDINDTRAGRSRNRRVEILVLRGEHDDWDQWRQEH